MAFRTVSGNTNYGLCYGADVSIFGAHSEWVAIAGTTISLGSNHLIYVSSRTIQIAHFADAGGGEVTVETLLAHGLSTGEIITIGGTTHYDLGIYTVTNVDATHFKITHTWDGDDATGGFYRGSGYQIPSGVNGLYQVTASFNTNINVAGQNLSFALVKNTTIWYPSVKSIIVNAGLVNPVMCVDLESPIPLVAGDRVWAVQMNATSFNNITVTNYSLFLYRI